MNFGLCCDLNDHFKCIQNDQWHFGGQRTFDIIINLWIAVTFRWIIVELTSVMAKVNANELESVNSVLNQVIYLYGIWSFRQRNLSLLDRSLRRFMKSLRADPVPRIHSSSRSFISDVLRKLCVFCRFTGWRFCPLYSKLGMQIFNTWSIWWTRCGVWDKIHLKWEILPLPMALYLNWVIQHLYVNICGIFHIEFVF